MGSSNNNLMALQDEALDLNESGDKNRNSNEYLIMRACDNGNLLVLKLFVKHLRAGNHDLYSVQELCKTMQDKHMERIEEQVTVPAVRIYSELMDFLPKLEGHHPTLRHHLLMTAVLSGETDVELVCAVIRERRPKDGYEFKAAMELVRSVPTPSLSSGVL